MGNGVLINRMESFGFEFDHTEGCNDSFSNHSGDITVDVPGALQLIGIIGQAVIDDRLATWQRFRNIHEKYPSDDSKSDREFRNDFMENYSKFMDETTEMIKLTKGGLTN